MQCVRVYATAAVDNPDVQPLHFDCMINGDQFAGGKRPVFGMQGSFKQNATTECYPFILYRNGNIDYGSGYDEAPNERMATIDLFDGPATIGRLLTLDSVNYGRQFFRIERIEKHQD